MAAAKIPRVRRSNRSSRMASALKLENLRSANPRWQWLDGFAEWTAAAPSQSDYLSFLGSAPSHWTYGDRKVAWQTTPALDRRERAIVFAGSSDFGQSEAELRIGDSLRIRFPTGVATDFHRAEGNVELYYFHGTTIPNNGISGVYVVHVPASAVTPGKPITLSMHMVKNGGWIMCHGITEVTKKILDPFPLPGPAKNVIAAFTPHRDGQFGVTIADFEIGG